jgi:hypothetical protein
MTPKGITYVDTYPLRNEPHIDIAPTGQVAIQDKPPPPKPKRLAWFLAGFGLGLVLIIAK